jgi:hypothetical protein
MTWRDRLRPTRSDWIDLGFAVALCSLAIIGFRTSFSGHEELTVGIPAVLVGAGVGYVIAKLRQPLVVSAALGIAAFFLFGGIALHDDALLWILPTPAVFTELVDGLVHGWARLLTTLPPAGQAGNLLAMPYMCGFVGASLCVILALRTSRWPWCIVPPVGVLVTTVLFGVDEPAALVLQGAVFGGVAIAWASMREQRRRGVDDHATIGHRLARAGLILVAVVLGAVLIGPKLPLADAHDRYVLRDTVEPPFDPSEYPSPLAGYRNYKIGEGERDFEKRRDEVLMTVDGLPEGAAIRWAVMDDYDGLAWRVVGAGTDASGRFDHVGDKIENPSDGAAASVTFEIEEPADDAKGVDGSIWVPLVGAPTGVHFAGPRADELTEAFRFNRATDAGAAPIELHAGDRYTVDTVIPPAYSADELAGLGIDRDLLTALDEAVVNAEYESKPIASIGLDDKVVYDDAYSQATALRDYFVDNGVYNDGGPKASESNLIVPPGHGLSRLVPFIGDNESMIGNDEQYAAALALLARAHGLPARVVMGWRPETGGRVELTRGDAAAWVEIGLEDVGWVPLVPRPNEDAPPVEEPEPQPKEVANQQPPPPTVPPPPNRVADELDPNVGEENEAREPSGGGSSGLLRTVLVGASVAMIPIALLATPLLIVLALKARRRRKRRRAATPAAQVAGGWQEVVDCARDRGLPVPAHATRREIGRVIANDMVVDLAARTDSVLFGAADPSGEDADRIWNEADAARAELLENLGRGARVRAALSLTSLRASR